MITPNWLSWLSGINVVLCLAVARLGDDGERRSSVHRAFVGGMLAMALAEACTTLGVHPFGSTSGLFWIRAGLIPTAILPGFWLFFAMTFARPRDAWKRQKWLLSVVFFVPFLLGLTVWGRLWMFPEMAGDIRLGPIGRLFYFVFFLCCLLVLVQLERTLRAAAGIKRYRVKFMVIGVGLLFAIFIYLSSQAILFVSLPFGLHLIQSVGTLAATLFILASLLRSRMEEGDLYVSSELVFRSITLLAVGAYLIIVGLLATLLNNIGGLGALPIGTLLLFVTMMGLIVLLLSDSLKERTRRFISRNLVRPHYDYRKEWIAFTQGTLSQIEIPALCSTICRMISQTYGAPSVSIWLIEEKRISFGGSTRFTEGEVQRHPSFLEETGNLCDWMDGRMFPVDFHDAPEKEAAEFRVAHRHCLEWGEIDYCVALISGEHFLGLLTVSERVSRAPFSLEDFDLLKTFCDQAAGTLLNARLAQHLVHTKERETFQKLSAFFIHDLKNLASTLSLTLQNIPAHYDNPEFRGDAMRVIGQSVTKMNAMCSQLSHLGRPPTLNTRPVDLNALIAETLDQMQYGLPVVPQRELTPLPPLTIDPEQIQKVVVNLILNARDAVAEGGKSPGEIRVTTLKTDGWAVLSVADNGCGIPADFIAHHLFHPLQTTKSEGLGIGLHHCKTIVESHHGRIFAESEPGAGATFRVMLPLEDAPASKITPPLP